MKKLFLAILTLFVASVFTTTNSYAGACYSVDKHELTPVSKNEEFKASKKLIKEIRRTYRQEMKGMNRAEKKTFVEEKIAQSNVNIPRLRLLIIGLVLILIGAIFYLLPILFWLAYLLQSVGGIIILIWLILWLLDYA